MFKVPEQYRDTEGSLASNSSYGTTGSFTLKHKGFTYHIICSDGLGWEHVSVHLSVNKKMFTPNWDQMCFVKDLFWDKTDCVVQYHPADSEYVNLHPNTLHLWRPTNEPLPIPLKIMVG